jgi:hypothetical protein
MKYHFLLVIVFLSSIVATAQLGEYYDSNGHPKAKGLNFKIKKPLGFEQNEADRPNIVQKWEKSKTNNDKYVAFMIIVKKLDSEMRGFSKKEWTNFLKNEGGIDMLASEFKNTSNKNFLVVDNYPAAIFDTSYEVERLNFKFLIYFSQITVFVEDYSFVMQLQSLKKSNLEKNKKLFYLLANSVIFPNQY